MRSLVRFQLAPLRGPLQRRARQMQHSPPMDFPPGFFDRADASSDAAFYRPLRLVTHIDDGAIAAVGALYDELGIDGEVLDLMSSWVSHFTADAAPTDRPRDERRRARRQPAGRGAGRARPQRGSGAAVRRRLVRRRGVLRVGRLPRAADRGVRRRRPGGAARRAVRLHVLEPVLPDQGHPGLAVRRPTPSTARSWPSTSGAPAGSTSR